MGINSANFDTLLVFSQGDTLTPIPILSGDLENTLQMYSAKDSFTVFLSEWYIKIFKINETKFGIIGDSLFRIYRIDNGRLKKLTTEKDQMQLQHFVITDVTNDGFDDAVIYDNAGGLNYETKVLVFDPATKILHHKSDLDLTNLEVDKKTHLLKTWSVAHSMYGVNSKALYCITNGSKELMVKILCYSKSDGTSETVMETVKMKNGNLRLDSMTTTGKNAFDLFHKTLWDTRRDFDDKKFDN